MFYKGSSVWRSVSRLEADPGLSRFFGAGLLANAIAIAHADYRLLKQRVRPQAGSYGVNIGACISPYTGIVQVNAERPRNMSRIHVNPGMI